MTPVVNCNNAGWGAAASASSVGVDLRRQYRSRGSDGDGLIARNGRKKKLLRSELSDLTATDSPIAYANATQSGK